jgi:pilus assembly protein CpaF
MSNDCIVVGELKGEEALLFFDSVSTGHRGYATVHSDSSLNTVDRLVTLMKRDNRAQMYTDTYLTKLLAQSIDVVIYMENFKVQEITEINYNSELQEVQYNPLYVFDVEKYENGKSIGTFKKKNSPKWKAKKKLELSKMEIEKVI